MKRLFPTALLLLAPTIAFAASPHTFKDLANLLVSLLNAGTGVIIVAGIAIYFYGVSTNILKFGEGDIEKLKNYFLWGIIVLFVMVSIWGILQLLQTTLFGTERVVLGTLQIVSENQLPLPDYA